MFVFSRVRDEIPQTPGARSISQTTMSRIVQRVRGGSLLADPACGNILPWLHSRGSAVANTICWRNRWIVSLPAASRFSLFSCLRGPSWSLFLFHRHCPQRTLRLGQNASIGNFWVTITVLRVSGHLRFDGCGVTDAVWPAGKNAAPLPRRLKGVIVPFVPLIRWPY